MIIAIAICHNCEFGNFEGKCNGKCECSADLQRRDISIHADNAHRGKPSCPKEKHNKVASLREFEDSLPPWVAREPLQPIPRDKWTAHADHLAKYSKASDIGLGSTCKRIIEAADDMDAMAAVAKFIYCEFGVQSFVGGSIKLALRMLIGGVEQDCTGCQLRQAESDAKYPLNLSS